MTTSRNESPAALLCENAIPKAAALKALSERYGCPAVALDERLPIPPELLGGRDGAKLSRLGWESAGQTGMTDPGSRARTVRESIGTFLRRVLPKRGRPVEQIFTEFRAVMAAHDQALEIVADIGEKLGGEYLFDIVYLRTSYDLLAARIAEMIEGFDSLVAGKYPGLGQVRVLIDREVRRLLYDLTPPESALILNLDEMTWERAAEVGGKISHLAEVRNHLGLLVPEGFGVTTGAFDEFIRHNDIEHLLKTAGESDPAVWAPAVREQVLQGSVPADLRAAIADAMSKLVDRHGAESRLAVRSSAGGEDGDYSFAGQFATVLNVPPELEAVLNAYRTVVASLYTEGALTYLRHLGMNPAESRMAVGCLLMVPARASGVLYTRDPAAPGNELIISTAWGLGAAVVEGSAEADLVADEQGAAIYEGLLREALRTTQAADEMKDLYEFRRKRSVLTYLTTLTLLDPEHDDFSPEGCRSLHDILRFVHEKALQELLERVPAAASTAGRWSRSTFPCRPVSFWWTSAAASCSHKAPGARGRPRWHPVRCERSSRDCCIRAPGTPHRSRSGWASFSAA